MCISAFQYYYLRIDIEYEIRYIFYNVKNLVNIQCASNYIYIYKYNKTNYLDALEKATVRLFHGEKNVHNIDQIKVQFLSFIRATICKMLRLFIEGHTDRQNQQNAGAHLLISFFFSKGVIINIVDFVFTSCREMCRSLSRQNCRFNHFTYNFRILSKICLDVCLNFWENGKNM